jgi:hypothetical protein
VLQIIDDHQEMWLNASSDEERDRVAARLRKQLAYAGVNFFGLEVTIHGAIALAADPLQGGFLMVAGVVLMYLTSGRN